MEAIGQTRLDESIDLGSEIGVLWWGEVGTMGPSLDLGTFYEQARGP